MKKDNNYIQSKKIAATTERGNLSLRGSKELEKEFKECCKDHELKVSEGVDMMIYMFLETYKVKEDSKSKVEMRQCKNKDCMKVYDIRRHYYCPDCGEYHNY